MFGEAKLTNRFGNTVKLSVFASLLGIYCGAQERGNATVQLSVQSLSQCTAVEHVGVGTYFRLTFRSVKQIDKYLPMFPDTC